MPGWDLWLRRFYLWTLTFTAPAAALAWQLGGVGQALGVVWGALIGLVNLQLLGRAVFRIVQEPADQLRAASQRRFAPLAALVRWPLTALATVAVLWYMPGQPEGLAAGVSIALLGFVTAGLQAAAEAERQPPRPDEDEDEPLDHRYG